MPDSGPNMPTSRSKLLALGMLKSALHLTKASSSPMSEPRAVSYHRRKEL